MVSSDHEDKLKDMDEDDFTTALNGQMGNLDAMFDGSTNHAEDALDFSDEDELADEEEADVTSSLKAKDVPESADEESESDDDLMKELQQEAMQGVDGDEAAEAIPGGLFTVIGDDSNNAGLADLDFEHANALMDEDDDDEMGFPMEDQASKNHQEDSKDKPEGQKDVAQVGEDDLSSSSEDDDDEIERKQAQEELKLKLKLERIEKEKRNREKLLKIYYPSFKRGKPLKMQSLFPIAPLKFNYQEPPMVPVPLLPSKLHFEFQADTRKSFRTSSRQTHSKEQQQIQLQQKNSKLLPKSRHQQLQTRLHQLQLQQQQQQQQKQQQIHSASQKIIEVTESDVINTQPPEEVQKKPKETIVSYDKSLVLSTADWDDDQIINCNEKEVYMPPSKKLKVEDLDLDGWDDDDDEMIFEGILSIDSLNLKLDMNDPRMLFTNESMMEPLKRKMVNQALIPLNERSIELRFSISNDKEYDILKENYQSKIRATIGNLTIDHSLPAIRLQSPFYRVRLSSKAARSNHRPQFTVRPNTTMVFSKPKLRKRKKDKGKDVKELFKNTTDLTLGDTANFFMLEYSEESPITLNNFGMGSMIINYYRKQSEDDNVRPKLSVGETHVVGVQDRSPFWNFGFVEPGNIVPTLYNQMVRAPIFKHDPLSTDFLLIRSSGGGSSQRYFLRHITHIFTVGQTLPVVDVPGPHSRKVTSTSKSRLKMIVYRVLNASPQRRLLVRDVSDHFPDQNDMQNRQRLKEFMEYQRSGEDQGYWKVKSDEKLPNYEETRKMITAEDISLLESMQVGQQRLDDFDSFRREKSESGNSEEGTNSTKEKEKKEKDINNDESLAIQLAPWNTTRNFISATQGKAMLQIHGEGEPSGKGEAISFLRTSMKGGFIKAAAGGGGDSNISTPKPLERDDKKSTSSAAHSYNVAVQQKLYDEEIAKVWYKQQRSLNTVRSTDKPRLISQSDLDDRDKLTAADKEVNEELGEPGRFLKITRMVRDSYGILQRKIEIIKDPKVVELYIKKRQKRLLEDPLDLASDKLVLTNDAEENKKVKKKLEEELAKLQKLQEKKKKKSPGITAANIDSEGRISGKGIGKGKSTSRRCATCGSLGHIRTNKTCPLYFTVHNKSNPNYIPGTEGAADLLQSTDELNSTPTNSAGADADMTAGSQVDANNEASTAQIFTMLRRALISNASLIRPTIARQPQLFSINKTILARFLSTETKQAIDTAVASAPVVLFMKGTPEAPACGFSRATIQILGQQGVDPVKFAAYNVLEDPELRQGIKEYSEWPTIPQLYVNKEFIGGCDIIMSMSQSGELAELLDSADALVPEDEE
ncbi:hypothetical protein CANARDRAFT_7546 [[Candida] arabinofermentans NRRL YB-2248]|uniref:Monothiol glutaredoxin-5, mitochondrial n=1 Tax=[Candida] arabinofermentans NRRL YB-2248 TaxID=983967 RepID=A0A1E4T138_9ASCO|nr:hypothetical protein CANARDRAFT_7546 [[Candida] arabinofermentans NRRL YB-2248]